MEAMEAQNFQANGKDGIRPTRRWDNVGHVGLISSIQVKHVNTSKTQQTTKKKQQQQIQ
jgi:hypothetical protein